MVTIAVGMVAASEQLETDQLENFVMVGELALNGAVRSVSYLDLCARAPNARAILFAGDADHPDADVYRKLRAQTDLLCLANGLAGAQGEIYPLQINLPGARAARRPRICNPVVSIELDNKGNSTLLAGNNCEACPAHLVP